jgi:hypothetical protein
VMLPSQTEFEALIKRLKSQTTELAEIDAKEDLPLSSEGDKAFFIHHVAALANNASPSFLVIGIEDKSWELRGLSSDSPLLNSDHTQNRMNQILEKRLDPQLAIRYRTYEHQGKTLGLVAIEGSRAPYLIAIDDDRYGGNRTKGENCFIFRGVIYVRHGGSTIIANRQSRILEILNQSGKTGTNGPNEFLIKNNYVDVDAENYGRNSLTSQLIEITHSTKPGTDYDTTEAKSWVSFVFSPIANNCKIDTVSLVTKLKPDNRIGREGKWYHGLPRPISDMLFYAKGTPKSFSGNWFPGNHDSPTEYTHAISILPDGNIQIAATYPLFYEREFYSMNVRFYSFVNLIGYFWQLVYLVKAIYKDADYHGNTRIIINLVGSAKTFMADLAKGPTKKWISIGDWEYSSSSHDQVQEDSIRIERQIHLAEASDDEIETMIRDIAGELGKYYGQQSPKCFTPDTNEFPVNDYISRNSR